MFLIVPFIDKGAEAWDSKYTPNTVSKECELAQITLGSM